MVFCYYKISDICRKNIRGLWVGLLFGSFLPFVLRQECGVGLWYTIMLLVCVEMR